VGLFYTAPEPTRGVKWLHLTGELDKCIRFSCQIFAGFNIPKICTVNFRHTYSKNKKVNVIGTQCICCLYHFWLTNLPEHGVRYFSVYFSCCENVTVCRQVRVAVRMQQRCHSQTDQLPSVDKHTLMRLTLPVRMS